MKIKNILAPTDFSDTSLKAMDFAANLCKKVKANLHLVNIVELNPIIAPHQMIVSTHVNEELINISKENLVKHTNDLKSKYGIHIRKNTYTGPVYDGIIRAAHLLDIDMIILGSTGANSLTEKLFGTTTSRLLNNTTIPVLTIHNIATEGNAFKKIILPFNDELATLKKTDYVSFLAQLTDSEIIVYGFTTNQNQDKTIKQAEKIVKQLEKKKLNARYIIETGKDYQSAVLAMATQLEADLISTICNQEHSFFTLFSSNHQNKIVNEANIPVLSIPIFDEL